MSDKFFTVDTDNIIMVYAKGEKPRNEDAEQFESLDELTALIEKWPAQRTLEIHNGMLPSVTEFPDPVTAAKAIWDVVSKLQPPKAVTHKEPIMKKQQPKAKAAPKAKPEPKPKAVVAPKKTKAERKAERAAAKAAKKEAQAKAKAEAKAAKKSAGKKTAKAKTPKAPKTPRDPNAPKQPGSSVTPSEKPPREGSKGEKIIKLMLRSDGATLNEIAKVLDQEMHTAATKKDPLATSRGYLSGLRQRFAKFYTITSEKEEGGKVRRYKAVAVK